jgi:hypothetical protein
LRIRISHNLLAFGLMVSSTTAWAQFCPAGNPRVAPNSRYSIAEPVVGQQVVTDLATGLIWKRCSEGQTGATCTGAPSSHTWSQALTLANGATHAGFADWRLPNVEELYSLVETGCFIQTINTTVFPGMVPDAAYWSSTTNATSPTSAYEVVFNAGFVSWSADNKNFSRLVRLVRGGPGRSNFDSGQEILLRDGFE